MIVTAKPRVPFLWLIFALLPWTAVLFKFQVMGTTFTFSLMKYVENPAGLAMVLSLPGFVSIFMRPFVNFTADRIWTRWGRRKPFIIPSWIGVIIILTLMPLMPNFWALLACYMAYQLVNDFGDPIEQLKMEIVPPCQRGTSTAISTWLLNLSLMTFNFIALGRFDDHQFMAGFPITGEESLYWSAAIAMSCMIMLVMFGIKETNPHSAILGERFSLKNFFRGITVRHLWPVYLLIFAWAIFHSGLGVLGTLLMIEQWGFTKQDMGTNMVVGGTLNIFIIGFIIVIADKLDRMKWFLRLLVLSLCVNICYYLYINYVLYDATPTLVEIIFFGETLSIIGTIIGVMYTPLVYDFVHRNELGTFQAGQSLLGRLTNIITMNGIGIFTWLYATLLMPPGGETARIVFPEILTQKKAEERIRSITWKDPVSNQSRPASDLCVTPWYATNAKLDHGYAFEVRLKNDDSVRLKKERDNLANKKAPLEAKLANARQMNEKEEAEELEATIRPLEEKIQKIDQELARRAKHFEEQIRRGLGSSLLSPADSILSAQETSILLCTFPLTGKPDLPQVEKALNRLRHTVPETVDLRLGYDEKEKQYRLTLSLVMRDDADLEKRGSEIAATFERILPEGLRAFTQTPLRPLNLTKAKGASLDIWIVEDPLNRHISPINRVFYWLLSWVIEIPGPDRRIIALGRSMRELGNLEHVRVTTVEGNEHAIRVIALRPQGAPPPSTGSLPAEMQTKLQTLLGNQPDVLGTAETAYQRLLRVAGEQRITVVTPILGAEFKPLKYDYMSGYIWFCCLQIIGIFIIRGFLKKVKLGLIRRRGVEEMEAST